MRIAPPAVNHVAKPLIRFTVAKALRRVVFVAIRNTTIITRSLLEMKFVVVSNLFRTSNAIDSI